MSDQDEDPRVREHRERELLRGQLSAQEVPGFHARTLIDDAIGKLYATRRQIRAPVPDGLQDLVEQVDALTDAIVDLAFDPDAPEVEDSINEGVDSRLGYLDASGSSCVSHCSCGGLFSLGLPKTPD